MKYAFRFLFSLLCFALFGAVVGAVSGAVAGLLIEFVYALSQFFASNHSGTAIGGHGLMLLIATGIGAAVGIPAGWVIAFFRRFLSATLALSGLVICFLGFIYGPTKWYGLEAIALFVVCIGAVLIPTYLTFALRQNRLNRVYLTGLRSLARSRPPSGQAWVGMLVTLGMIGSATVQFGRCRLHGQGALHQATESRDVLRLLVETHDHPPCLCPRPDEITLQARDYWNQKQDHRVNYVRYVVSDSLLLAASDPNSGWGGGWDSLSLADLRQLVRSGATFDTLTYLGYPNAFQRQQKPIPAPF